MGFSRELFEQAAREQGADQSLVQELLAYADQLVQDDLPVIFSTKHWALMMGMSYGDLRDILDNRDIFYREFTIPKKSGGRRRISAPQNELKSIQLWIKENILDKLTFPEYVTAYQKNRSIINNAAFHVGSELILKFDLENYFDTISEPKVFGLFQILGYHKSVSIDLAKACCIHKTTQVQTNNNGQNNATGNNKRLPPATLPQGAPTSPAISNLAAYRLDLRLNAYAQRHSYTYSRYADDLTFSGKLDNKLKKHVIRKIVTAEKFVLNERKGSYKTRSDRQIVTGLNVNNKVSISKKFRKTIATHLHNCIQFGPDAHLANIGRKHRYNYRDWLLGNILYIHSVHPVAGAAMRAKFERINWL